MPKCRSASSIADCIGTPTAVGAAGEVATRGAAESRLTSVTFLSLFLLVQFATTRPVTTTLTAPDHDDRHRLHLEGCDAQV